MLTKTLKELTLADIERLKENGVSESRFIRRHRRNCKAKKSAMQFATAHATDNLPS